MAGDDFDQVTQANDGSFDFLIPGCGIEAEKGLLGRANSLFWKIFKNPAACLDACLKLELKPYF